MNVVIYLLALTLSATDGHEIARKAVAGPFKDVAACSTAQQKTGTQAPKDGVITVYSCAVR